MTGNDLDILSPFVLVMAATMLIEDEPGGFQLLDQDSSIHFAFLEYMRTLCALSTGFTSLISWFSEKSVGKS